MLIKDITVLIEYRIQCGHSKPNWKALRARVKSPDGNFGSDLFTPNITNIDMAISRALLALQYCDTVTFEFSESIGLPPRRYRNGRFLPPAIGDIMCA